MKLFNSVIPRPDIKQYTLISREYFCVIKKDTQILSFERTCYDFLISSVETGAVLAFIGEKSCKILSSCHVYIIYMAILDSYNNKNHNNNKNNNYNKTNST